MKNMTCIKNFPAPEVDRCEVLRYAGVRESDEQTEDMLSDCIKEVRDKLSYKVCWREYDLNYVNGELDTGFAKINSSSLKKTLTDCRKIVVFCATVGVEIDRLIARYSVISPARAISLQAIGTERVEALCDAFCSEMADRYAEQGSSTTRRFSPGYGDLCLDIQRDIFCALDVTKLIGVSLGDNLFMTPTKSVTAIFGVKM